MKTFIAFLTVLPELIRLIKNIEKRIQATETDKKVKEDIKAINEAFEQKDSAKLNRIFDS